MNHRAKVYYSEYATLDEQSNHIKPIKVHFYVITWKSVNYTSCSFKNNPNKDMKYAVSLQFHVSGKRSSLTNPGNFPSIQPYNKIFTTIYNFNKFISIHATIDLCPCMNACTVRRNV
jgi:hypothetical protein